MGHRQIKRPKLATFCRISSAWPGCLRRRRCGPCRSCRQPRLLLGDVVVVRLELLGDDAELFDVLLHLGVVELLDDFEADVRLEEVLAVQVLDLLLQVVLDLAERGVPWA